MTYKLAKQLKDAGFPQDKDKEGNWYCKGDDDKQRLEIMHYQNSDGSHVYVPTLSELIESCGDNFSSIEKKKYKAGWIAEAVPEEGGDWSYAEAKIPEEAIAKLWLALNK